jgi:hypothetical protein
VWISWLSLKTKIDNLPVFCPQNYRKGFPGLGIKIGGYGLVI